MNDFLHSPQGSFSVRLWTVEVDGEVATSTAFERLDQPATEHLVGVP